MPIYGESRGLDNGLVRNGLGSRSYAHVCSCKTVSVGNDFQNSGFVARTTWPSKEWVTFKNKVSGNPHKIAKSFTGDIARPTSSVSRPVLPAPVVRRPLIPTPVLPGSRPFLPRPFVPGPTVPVPRNYVKQITTYFPRPGLCVDGRSKSKNVEPVRTVRTGKTEVGGAGAVKGTPNLILPPNLFKIAKRMCSILKCTHHLGQVSCSVIPKQISKHSQILKSFPKPFAVNEQIKKKIFEVANKWSSDLCSALANHYLLTRNSDLGFLEEVIDCTEEDWETCLKVAERWTGSTFKNFHEGDLKEGRELIKTARLKSLEKRVEDEGEGVEEETEAETAEMGETAQVSVPSSGPFSQEESPIGHSSGFTFENTKISKKVWKIPANIEEKKLLITDDNFVGPVASDFFHLTLPKTSIWDLYNVFRNSNLKSDFSLILIHIGYKSTSDCNLKCVRTIIEKLRLSHPNTKIFFTSLVSKLMDKYVARFNNYCKDNISDFFLNCDLRDISFESIEEKSGKLFVAWNSTLISLN